MTTYPQEPGHVPGVETSKEAADSMRQAAPTIRARVLASITAAAGGLTCDQIEVGMNLTHQTASARIAELARMGHIRPAMQSGRPVRRRTRSGRSARVYIAASPE